MTTTFTECATWAITLLAIGGVIGRPWRSPEAVWAVLGAVTLVALSLVPWRVALAAVENGKDVYLFLAGMMLLAELARQQGVFAWLAALAARRAQGSASRLFALVFAVGVVITVLLSNDATAVVLTPAVYAITKALDAEPLPYLFACAFIANAASFVLPISNPANLVLFDGHMPALSSWLAEFSLPSALSIGVTFLVLRLTQRASLRRPIAHHLDAVTLSRGGRITVWGIVGAVAMLLTASALNAPLGPLTFVAGAATAGIVMALERRSPWELVRHISWSVLPLVAGLFVLVDGLVRTGIVPQLSQGLQTLARTSPIASNWVSGLGAASASNLINNLPVGLIAASSIAGGSIPSHLAQALLIGIDLGANISLTGSLAAILWILSLRREGLHVTALAYLRLGLTVTVPALIAALAGLTLLPVK